MKPFGNSKFVIVEGMTYEYVSTVYLDAYIRLSQLSWCVDGVAQDKFQVNQASLMKNMAT